MLTGEIPKDVLEFIEEVALKAKGYNVYLGGGFLRDVYWNRKQGYAQEYGWRWEKEDHEQSKQPKALDLFFIPDGSMFQELPIVPKTYINYDIPAIDIEHCRPNVKHVRGLFYKKLWITKDIQFIVYDKHLDIESLAEDMDTSVNQIMYDVSKKEFHMTEAFISSHENKVIEMLHEFEPERMYKRLVRMKKKFPDYTLKHNISDDDWEWFECKAAIEKKRKRSGTSTGSFIEE